MRMEKRTFRIGELAKKIGVERFVIRFWEKEFSIKPQRSEGGQRFYTERDYMKFQMIKELLYDKKFTIAGAKTELQQLHIKKEDQIIPSHRTIIESEEKKIEAASNELKEQLIELKEQLIKLKKLL